MVNYRSLLDFLNHSIFVRLYFAFVSFCKNKWINLRQAFEEQNMANPEWIGNFQYGLGIGIR